MPATIGGFRPKSVGVTGWNTQFCNRACLFHQRELLHTAAGIGLGDVEIAARIDGHGVPMREVSEPVSGASEARQNSSACMVEDMQLFVAAVHDVHECLFGIA